LTGSFTNSTGSFAKLTGSVQIRHSHFRTVSVIGLVERRQRC
jgi:hypothetical protein